jgi:hypothetical protein
MAIYMDDYPDKRLGFFIESREIILYKVFRRAKKIRVLEESEVVFVFHKTYDNCSAT